jgi:hypothetical protein
MFTRLFKHPTAVCMTYTSHGLFALRMSLTLFTASFKSLIHAFLPDLFITSTTDCVEYVSQELKKIGCRPDVEVSIYDYTLDII